MGTRYYYLVTGLPDLLMEDKRAPAAMDALEEEIRSCLDEEDRALLPVLRYPADNANLITLLEKKNRPFIPSGNFNREELEVEIKSPHLLPDYAAEFAAAFRENKPPLPHLCAEDQLAWLFYEFAASHPHPFISGWFTFDLNLRNVLAAMNCREMATVSGGQAPELMEKSVLGRNEVAALLLKSGAPDFALSQLFPEIEALSALPAGRLEEREKGLDAIRIRALDDIAFLADFSVDAVFAFLIKLDIVRRWAALDNTAGRARLDELVTRLKGNPA